LGQTLTISFCSKVTPQIKQKLLGQAKKIKVGIGQAIDLLSFHTTA